MNLSYNWCLLAGSSTSTISAMVSEPGYKPSIESGMSARQILETDSPSAARLV